MPRGLHFESTRQGFTLLLRQHDGFGIMLFICLAIGLSTLGLEEMAFLPVHQRIHCNQKAGTCTYTQVQIHPFLFWKTGVKVMPVDQIDDSSYSLDKEWEIELTDNTSIIMGSGAKAELNSQGLKQFLAGERTQFQASDHHPFVAIIQLLMWGTFLFPFYILLLDRTDKPRSTQSVYIDAQVTLLKKYNFSGHLHQESIPTSTLKRLEIKRVKKEKNRYAFSLIAHTSSRKVTFIYKADAAIIDQINPLNAEEKMKTLVRALQEFLANHGVEVRVT